MESDGTIYLTQKDQGKKLQPVNEKGENLQQDYLKQCARGVYIALIYQLEALFDLSVIV